MGFKEIFLSILILLLIPLGIVIWVNNKISYASQIEDLTLLEYVSPTISEEEFNQLLVNEETSIEQVEPQLEQIKKTSITMNFVGDCTLGSDSNFGYKNTFFNVYDREQNDGYFFSNMQELFANDDITVANLEGTFTDYTVKTPKKFNFRAPPHYANILISGDIDIVNICNNHIKDYGQKGYDDTLDTLSNYGIPYFGFDNYYIYEKDGIKVGFVGLASIWDGTINNRIDKAIAYFNENNCNSIIFTFHWGTEREYKQNSSQIKVAHYAIDHGADLVIAHHPHVLQGIEEYNGKYIVYSLGNFCFGGNTNPPDKDTMVFNVVFEYEDGMQTNVTAKIYPARVSSVNNVNDFRPTLAQEQEYDRIIQKVLKYSNIEVDDNGVIKKGS